MPVPDAPAAVRRPTAIAIDSSSSSSSGGIALPAANLFMSAGTESDSTGEAGWRLHREAYVPQPLDVSPDRAPLHLEAIGDLAARPVAPRLKQREQLQQSARGLDHRAPHDPGNRGQILT